MSANVKSFQALAELKNAFGIFSGEVRTLLPAVYQEISRVREWIAERERYWLHQVERAREMVRQAKNALQRCLASRDDDRRAPDCSSEQSALAQARAHLHQVEYELENVRRWKNLLEQAIFAFEREAARLLSQLESDVPKAQALLEKILATLQSYAAEIAALPKAESTTSQTNKLDFTQETQRQIDLAVASLRQIVEIKPEAWKSLNLKERMNALMKVEERMAEIQGRQVIPIRLERKADPNEFGGYNGEFIKIYDQDVVSAKFSVYEHVDTIVHEGRHAYQHCAVQTPGFVADEKLVARWAENFKAGNYIRPNDDWEGYRKQPVEADAWDYAERIIKALKQENTEET